MYTIEKKTLTDIADAIREKTGKSELILPGDMPGEIENIKGNSEDEGSFIDPIHVSVDADSVFNHIISGYPPFGAAQAFGSEKKHWWGANSSGDHWLMVTYAEPVIINRIAFSNSWTKSENMWCSNNIIFQGSDDNNTWVDLLTLNDLAESEIQSTYTVNNNDAYLQYRFLCNSRVIKYTGLGKIRLYVKKVIPNGHNNS